MHVIKLWCFFMRYNTWLGNANCNLIHIQYLGMKENPSWDPQKDLTSLFFSTKRNAFSAWLHIIVLFWFFYLTLKCSMTWVRVNLVWPIMHFLCWELRRIGSDTMTSPLSMTTDTRALIDPVHSGLCWLSSQSLEHIVNYLRYCHVTYPLWWRWMGQWLWYERTLGSTEVSHQTLKRHALSIFKCPLWFHNKG